MEELREKQKQEAVKRMKMLNIYDITIKEFAKENLINKSEHGGFLYWLNDEEKEMVKRFEEKYNSVVYHVIHNYTEFGELYSLLYVSSYEEEWDYDIDDIKNNMILSYVINKDDENLSEFGSIGIKPMFGGLARIC